MNATAKAQQTPVPIMTALIRLDPKEAKRRLLEVLKSTGMHKGAAARKLGCAHSTLIHWMKQLDMADDVERLTLKAVREGWHHGRLGGRPAGATVANGAAPRGSRVNPG